MRLKELFKKSGLDLSWYKGGDFIVKGVSCDSRQTQDGFVFIAVKGSLLDGSKFIEEARRNGAGIVVSQEVLPKGIDTRLAASRLAAAFYGFPAKKLRITGITGTNGKTTVTYLLEALLKEAGKNPAVTGTINYRFNNKIFPSNNTTPGPVQLQELFSRMAKSGVTDCIMEVSSHALDQARTAGVDFGAAIFTNLTSDHLDYHKTRANYFQAKAKLFKGLSRKSFAIINNDDQCAPLLKKISSARIITYGIDKVSMVMAKDIKFGPGCTEFSLKAPGKESRMKVKLIGRHNVYNVLAAVAWAVSRKIAFLRIKRALENFAYVPGRLERIESGKGFSVFVDYAHTEDALNNVISSLRQVSTGRIIVVFGCGGDRDKGKRPKMGRVVTELADYALITSDNPRSEEPDSIAGQIVRGIRRNNYTVILERRQAIRKSLQLAKGGDIVLIAGKGHEAYQIIKGKKIDFDDREVAKSCLK